MRGTPSISVTIPVYNCERYLGDAIESVLAQSYQPIEIIVIDDGSTDGSATVADRFEVAYRWQPHSGVGAARNRGVGLATGEFLAFLDADDLWVESKLERQMAALGQDPELDMVFGRVEQFVSPELAPAAARPSRNVGRALEGPHAGTLLIRRESFHQVGDFATCWQIGEFVDWYARAMEAGLKSWMLPKVVLRRRQHHTNLGIRKRSSQTDYVRILKATLDRRRGGD